ncbi:MAG: hypothetical protein ACXWIU_01805 [Limisphaerales bacterium]
MLPQDIITKVRQDFSKDDAIVIVQLLSELQNENPTIFCDRILRCIVFSAHGRFDWFESAVAVARIDWRDVIVNAEYDKDRETRRRDFNLPFTEMWPKQITARNPDRPPGFCIRGLCQWPGVRELRC